MARTPWIKIKVAPDCDWAEKEWPQCCPVKKALLENGLPVSCVTYTQIAWWRSLSNGQKGWESTSEIPEKLSRWIKRVDVADTNRGLRPIEFRVHRETLEVRDVVRRA